MKRWHAHTHLSCITVSISVSYKIQIKGSHTHSDRMTIAQFVSYSLPRYEVDTCTLICFLDHVRTSSSWCSTGNKEWPPVKHPCRVGYCGRFGPVVSRLPFGWFQEDLSLVEGGKIGGPSIDQVESLGSFPRFIAQVGSPVPVGFSGQLLSQGGNLLASSQLQRGAAALGVRALWGQEPIAEDSAGNCASFRFFPFRAQAC